MTTRICKATLLKSMKKGKTPIQCSHKAKNGTDYCGYHRNFVIKENSSSLKQKLHPAALKEDLFPPPSPDNIECAICWSDMTTDLVRTKCNHCFHSKCLEQWKKRANTCPFCRALLPRKNRYKFNRKVLRDLAIRMNMNAMCILRDNAITDSYDYEKYCLMIEIREKEDRLNRIY